MCYAIEQGSVDQSNVRSFDGTDADFSEQPGCVAGLCKRDVGDGLPVQAVSPHLVMSHILKPALGPDRSGDMPCRHDRHLDGADERKALFALCAVTVTPIRVEAIGATVTLHTTEPGPFRAGLDDRGKVFDMRI